MTKAGRPRSRQPLPSLPAQTSPADAGRLRKGSSGFNRRVILALLLIAHLALTIAYSAVVPLGEAPDEADHWAYIVYLAQERRLPEGPAMTQAKHPPLYHATAALVASLAEPRFDFLRANPDVQIAPEDWGEHGGPNFFIHTAAEAWPWRAGPLAFHLARLWSAVLSTLTVGATFGLLRAALPNRPAVAFAAAGFLAFLPEFAFIGGSANNDNLAALCGTLALWGGIAIFRAGAAARVGNASVPPANRTDHKNVMLSYPSRERHAPRQKTPLCHAERVASSKLVAANRQRSISSWEFPGSGLTSQRQSRRNPSDRAASLWEASRRDQRERDPSLVLGRHCGRVIDPLRVTIGSVLKAGWWTPLALGVGLLAKVSTAALWPVVAVAILAGMWLGEARVGRSVSQTLRCVLPRLLTIGLWVFLPALLLAAPWFWRNWTLYGDPLGMELARQTVDVRAGPWTAADTIWLLRGWFISFWGKFGGAGHIPLAGWLYSLLAVLTALAGAGVAWATLRTQTWRDRLALGLLALAAALTAAGIWQYSLVALGTDQGRLLYPAVGALAGLLVLGWLAWFPRRWERPAAAAVVLFSLALGLYGLLGVIRPAFAAPASAAWREIAPDGVGGDTEQAPTSGNLVARAVFGEIMLLGAELEGEPILYWTAASPPTQDWRAILRVVAEDGSLAWEWKRSPGAGRLSTDRWPAGYVMRDVYRVAWPEWAGPGRYRVEVAAYPFGGEPGAAVFVGWLTR